MNVPGAGGRPERVHAEEIDVSDDLVRRLLADQLPAWADLPLRRIGSTGTDNAIYRLGDELAIRLPRIHWAVDQVAKEAEWLPRLAPRLPVAVPEPVALGGPGCGYPYPWLVYRWVDGVDALTGPVEDWPRLAREVAGFVAALHAADTHDAPPAGVRGGPLGPVDSETRVAIERMDGMIDIDRALGVWEDALAADPWLGPAVWVHGDLLPGNVVVRAGALGAVIDWSAAGVGDPACDAMLAWAMPPDARAVYLQGLGFDEATGARGRGWALQQAVLFIPYYAHTIPDAVAAARRRLDAVLADPEPRSGGSFD